uniref:TF-B3 domain-containing protein n=1 Tax=Brassica campestris TaxID=3711 RepID=M4CE78_BRACM
MKKGDSSDDRLPKFFKVYLPNDSGDDLEIPVSFNSCLPSSVPKSVTVTNINGHVWKLKLKKLSGDPEKFSMVDGWKRIVKDEDLKGGEFLAFEFDGSRLFNFCVYGQATQLLDDPDSPSFTVILNPKKKSQLLIPSHIMKDYNLHFTERITIVDPLVPKFGTLERKIKLQDNGCLFVKGFGSVFRRNNVKTTDTIICEVKKNGNDVAHILKVHIVRGL